jgi:hypothetical protein
VKGGTHNAHELIPDAPAADRPRECGYRWRVRHRSSPCRHHPGVRTGSRAFTVMLDMLRPGGLSTQTGKASTLLPIPRSKGLAGGRVATCTPSAGRASRLVTHAGSAQHQSSSGTAHHDHGWKASGADRRFKASHIDRDWRAGAVDAPTAYLCLTTASDQDVWPSALTALIAKAQGAVGAHGRGREASARPSNSGADGGRACSDRDYGPGTRCARPI